jgi:acyl-CoA thioesterase-1
MDSKRRMILRYAAMSLFVASLVGCDGARRTGAADRAVEREHEDAPAPRDARPTIVFLGTSLTAGLGLDPGQAYPALIQKKLDSAGLDYQVVNAGVSGETSAGARGRIDWLLQQPAAVLVVETGANDGLRGLNVDSLRANIQAILDRARQQRPPPRLVLAGMAALPNFGADYGDRFRRVYPDLARANGATLVPFLLDGVAGEDRLNQADGVHPTVEGHRRIADNVWRVLEPLLRESTS